MALQLELYESQNGKRKHVSSIRFCSGECFHDDGSGEWDDAVPCDLGDFTCAHCEERFSVKSHIGPIPHVKITDEGDGYCVMPMDCAHEFIVGELQYIGTSEVGTKYIIEVVNAMYEATATLPEFDGF